MTKILLFAIWALVASPPTPATGNHPPIRVQVLQVSEKKGDILLALYNTSAGFPGDPKKAFRTAKGEARSGQCTIVLDQVPPGEYAIALFHDTNQDGKLNYNFLGIPSEGYGVSNNVKNLFSGPRFGQAAFHHRQATRLEIKMRY